MKNAIRFTIEPSTADTIGVARAQRNRHSVPVWLQSARSVGTNVPRVRREPMASKDRQRIQYVTASDGLRLAWADAGEGPLVVKASNWLTHLEYDWDSPVWRHWIRFFSAHFRFVRFDERGCGMSDWSAGDLSLDRWVADLEAIVDAAKPTGPVILLGISQGAAICASYAARHPECVSHLVLCGPYARGSWRRGF